LFIAFNNDDFGFAVASDIAASFGTVRRIDARGNATSEDASRVRDEPLLLLK